MVFPHVDHQHLIGRQFQHLGYTGGKFIEVDAG